MTFCDDCPDREACHQGMSCDLSRRFAFAASLYRQKMRGNTTMSNAKNSNVTPADVAAKAAEEKLVTTVPAQAEGEQTVEEPKTGEQEPKLTVVEGGKKSLKERLAEVAKTAKDNRKVLVGVGATIGAAALLFVKYAKRKAEEALVEAAESDEVADDQPATDESAA